MFDTEDKLVRMALQLFGKARSPWGAVELVTEWDYRHGRTDILLRTAGGALVAFEAKLTRWQAACDQAYRNTAYATQAYVLLPEDTAERAVRNSAYFNDRGIGLCTISGQQIMMLIESPVASPLMAWVTELAHSTFDGMKDAAAKSGTSSATRLCSA